MKVLPTARILIIDPQEDRRQILRDALVEFGVGGIQEASGIAEAADLAAQNDVVVVHVDDPENTPDNPFRDSGRVPAILIAEASAQALMRAAARGGYDAAVGAPLAPRLLYRRIGSVLQRARRIVRSGTGVDAAVLAATQTPDSGVEGVASTH